jgi:hypothetical protein
MLLHLPRMDGYGLEPRVKNGAVMGSYGAVAVTEAPAANTTTIPERLVPR